MTRAFLLAILLAAATVAACSDDGESGTGAECPTTNPPTYESFGKAFFDGGCISCHSSAKTGADRGGAPVGLDYDTLAGIREDLSRIELVAASGPDGTFTAMPPGPNKPTTELRTTLGQFLACEQAK